MPRHAPHISLRPAVRPLLSALLLPAVLGPAVGLVGPTATPAAADTVVVPDDTGDVWWYGEGPEGAQWVQVEDREQEDVTAVRVDHLPGRLVLTTQVVDLPSADQTPGAGPRHVVDRARGRDLGVAVDLTGNQTSVSVGSLGGAYQCDDDDTGVRVNRRTDVVVVTLDRACLGRQRWVRVTSSMSSMSGRHPYVDAVGNSGHDAGETTRRVYAR